nr:hypothetical protein [Methylomonas koyamae]
MSKKHPEQAEKPDYKDVLQQLQVELVKLQNHIIKHGDKILILFEGRDAGGKDGTIKRIIQHLSPREIRVVALGKPSDRDNSTWYFQRYTAHLPAAQELVLFNRSWYNRAGVERVMGFCSDNEYHEFIETVSHYEQLLVRSGIKLLKYYLDISKGEQKKRLAQRQQDPLKQWKISLSTRKRKSTGKPTARRATSCSPELTIYRRRGPSSKPTTKNWPESI